MLNFGCWLNLKTERGSVTHCSMIGNSDVLRLTEPRSEHYRIFMR